VERIDDMATTSTALVPLGDRDYLMKIVGRKATDKADVLNAITAQEAQALSDVAIVVKSESIGEAWQGGRNYLCQWLVSHFPIFDELAIRIHDRKRKGLSPLIIKGKPCSEFKEAIRLLLDTNPSYYYKLRKKHLGGGWQKRLPAEATAPEKKALPEAGIEVDPEPDAKDAEVVDDQPAPPPPTVAQATVDKVHSAANEAATETNVPESEVADPAPSISDEAAKAIQTIAEEEAEPENPLEKALLSLVPDYADDCISYVDDQRAVALKTALHDLPVGLFNLLEGCIAVVSDQLAKEEEKKEDEERRNKGFPEFAKRVQEALAEGHGLTASRILEAVNAKLGRKDYGQQEFYRGLKEGVGKKLWVKANSKYYLNANGGGVADSRDAERRKALVLGVLQKGKSLGATQVMEEIEKNPDWQEWGSHDDYYRTMKLGIGSDWFKRGSLYNIAPPPKKEEELTVAPEAIAQGDFSSISAH
jgi:hypothetical protein